VTESDKPDASTRSRSVAERWYYPALWVPGVALSLVSIVALKLGHRVGVVSLAFAGALLVSWFVVARRLITGRQAALIADPAPPDQGAEQLDADGLMATSVPGPHTYKASIWSRLWLAAMLPVPLLIVVSLSVALTVAVGDVKHPATRLLAAAVAVVALIFVALCLRTRVTVDGTHVTVHNPTKTHIITLQSDVIVSMAGSSIPYKNGVLLTITKPREAGGVRPRPVKVLATSSMNRSTFDLLRADLLTNGHGTGAKFDSDFYQVYKQQWT
jgi:hypothetical protein